MKLSQEFSRAHFETLLQYATPAQAVYIKGMLDSEIYCMAEYARKSGTPEGTIRAAVSRAGIKAAMHNDSPDHGMTHPTPPGYYLGLTTVQRNSEGNITQTWDRVCSDSEILRTEAIKLAILDTISTLKPFDVIPQRNTSDYDTEIVPFYNIGDAHIGMLAHEAETGANFDVKIATRELLAGLCGLIHNTTPSTKCVINDLGDATHYENMAGVTEGHGHMLDCDGRFVKMISAYVDIMIQVINCALTVHQTVDVIINQGNHSRTNDLWMRKLLEVLYANNPRVTIIDNTNVFTFYRLENVQILIHHGDKCKPDKLIDVLINDGRVDYGQTEHHYIWTGHVHHRGVSNEFRGIMAESFNILAEKDKWAHDGGYRSRQSITRVDIHRQYGEVGRATMNAQAVRALLKLKGA